MIKEQEYIGKTYNRLTILNFAEPTLYKNDKGHNCKRKRVNCQCSCGNIWEGDLRSLISNLTKSCGCFKKESSKTNLRNKIHGLKNTPEYTSWKGMKGRCLNPKNKDYKNYGGRGITVCEDWLKFENFYKDMGLKPSKNHSIDRINNNLSYCKENCKWSTNLEQQVNRRNNRKVINTETNEIYNTLTKAAKSINIGITTLHSQLSGKTTNKTKFKFVQN